MGEPGGDCEREGDKDGRDFECGECEFLDGVGEEEFVVLGLEGSWLVVERMVLRCRH